MIRTSSDDKTKAVLQTRTLDAIANINEILMRNNSVLRSVIEEADKSGVSGVVDCGVTDKTVICLKDAIYHDRSAG